MQTEEWRAHRGRIGEEDVALSHCACSRGDAATRKRRIRYKCYANRVCCIAGALHQRGSPHTVRIADPYTRAGLKRG